MMWADIIVDGIEFRAVGWSDVLDFAARGVDVRFADETTWRD